MLCSENPSIRLGLIIKGNGRCITPKGELALGKGKALCLTEIGQHCFYTDEKQMAIVIYHSDSK